MEALERLNEKSNKVLLETSAMNHGSLLRQRTASCVVKSESSSLLVDNHFTHPPKLKRGSSEGEVHSLLLKSRYDDYSSDGGESDDQNNNNNKYFGKVVLPKRKREDGIWTASALALRHGGSAFIMEDNIAGTDRPPEVQQRRNKRFTSFPRPNLKRVHRWLIPVNHPLKILWDVLTVILSIVNVILTHQAIRDRQFQSRPGFIELWFLVDILLNFLTQRVTDGVVLTNSTAVWAKYLTSWFVIDVLALFPGEFLYIQPVIELQKRRPLWQKLFRRTKVTIKVTTQILQSGHMPWLYKVIVKARPLGEGVRLIRLLIKYVPKYLLFVRNMKGVLVLRVLRDLGHFRTLNRRGCDLFGWNSKMEKDAATVDISVDEEDDDEDSEDWENLNEDEDHDNIGPC